MRRSGAAAADVKRWKFQSQMEFLLRFMGNEKRDTNFTNDDDSSEPSVEQDRHVELETQCSNDHLIDEKSCEDSTPPNTGDIEESDSANLSVRKDPPEPQTSRPRKKAKKVDIDNLIKKTLEQREQRSKERSEERKAPKDDLYFFFMSMYEQTKKMPAACQHIVKRNIFHAVLQEEARLLNISEPTAPPHHPFHSGIGITDNINQPRSNNWLDYSNTHSPASTCSSQRTPSYPSGETHDKSDTSNIVSFLTHFSE